jgi:hypothetical protein
MPVLSRSDGWTSRDALAHPFVAKCDQPDCSWGTAHRTHEEAVSVLAFHSCPWLFNMTQRVSDMAKGMNQFQRIWKELDEAYDKMESEGTIQDLNLYKGQMQGLAKAIVILMDPIFRSVRDVAVEAKLRRTGRVSGEPRETAGVDYRWTPNGKGDPIPSFVPDPASTAVAPKPPSTIDPKVIEQIQKALSSGVPFTNKELADMYKVSESFVKSLR